MVSKICPAVATGKLINWGYLESFPIFPQVLGSIFQNLPFSADEIEAFRLLIEDGKLGKTEIVRMMPGYSGREHKRFVEYYETIQQTLHQ